MRFSEWIERRLAEALNPELDRLKHEEKRLVASMEGRKDPSTGSLIGINKAGYVDAANKLKEVRAKIKASESGEVKPIPAWIQGRRAV